MLTELQKRKMKRAFLAYDRNNDGQIEHEEFITGYENLLRSRGLKPSHEAWNGKMAEFEALWVAQLAKADANKDGQVGYDEYLSYLEAEFGAAGNDPSHAPESFRHVIDALVSILDIDGDGLVKPEDYETAMQCFGIDDFDADANFATLDGDGDGALNREEVARLIREFFFSDDAAAAGNSLLGPTLS